MDKFNSKRMKDARKQKRLTQKNLENCWELAIEQFQNGN